MGYLLFTENMVINPARLGLNVGSRLRVICVGGGGGGACWSGSSYSGGDAGFCSKNYSGGAGGSGFGAGGGGGYSSYTDGGNAGAFKIKEIVLNNMNNISVTIGARGIGADGSVANSNGGNGGTSSFGSYVSATGGRGGTYHSTSWYGNFHQGKGGYIPGLSRIAGKIPHINTSTYRTGLLDGNSPFLPSGVSKQASYYNTYYANSRSYNGASLPVPGLAGLGVVIIEW